MQLRDAAIFLLCTMPLYAHAGGVMDGRSSGSALQEQSAEVVFLLHGICKTSADMWAMKRHLQRSGYTVVNWGYKSRKHSIEELADQLAAVTAEWSHARVHFVTHSMGGIIVRTYIARHHPQNVGRIVFIAPPNQGAEMADFLKDRMLYKAIFGPAGQNLCTGSGGTCVNAGVPATEFGIIAGGLGNSIGFNPLLPGDNDGTVTVASTRLEGSSDFLLLPHMHFFIQMMPATLRATERFLRLGRFSE